MSLAKEAAVDIMRTVAAFQPKRACEGAALVDGKCPRCDIENATKASVADARCAASQQALSQAEQLLTVQEYADRFGVHVQSVYSAIRRGHHVEGRVLRPTPRTIRIAIAA